MQLDPGPLLATLERLLPSLRALLAGLTGADTRWRPKPEAWSILEIVGHLLDEEREDFRPRLLGTLADPALPWAPIDPEGRVRARRWNEQTLEGLLEELDTERARSLALLRALERPDWTRSYTSPKLGTLSAGDLFVSWATHDLLHLRQLLARVHGLMLVAGEGASSGYAGDW